MKKTFYFFILILISSCASNKGVFWCGDHPCIDKKEKEAYFKKTMIVEVKELDKDFKNDDMDLKKIIEEAKKNEKKRILKEKNLKKQAKLKEKKIIKHRKKMENIEKKEEKEILKEISKKEDDSIKIKEEKTVVKENIKIGKFNDIVKKITKKNSTKPFPEINNIPN